MRILVSLQPITERVQIRSIMTICKLRIELCQKFQPANKIRETCNLGVTLYLTWNIQLYDTGCLISNEYLFMLLQSHIMQ